MIDFRSDNVVTVHPAIMESLLQANHATQSSYGTDDYSLRLSEVLADLFATEVSVYLTNTGTAANSLSLSALVNAYETVYCHHHAHIQTDECGAPELYTGGAKLTLIDGADGKLCVDKLQQAYNAAQASAPHSMRPGCISITQATEHGTVYSLDELARLNAFAQTHHLPIHMDGARFANSLVSLGCTPAQLTWQSGIDVLSLGATKNGAMAAEAVVFFNQHYAQHFAYLHKRAGQLMSKTRFFASQLLAYFKDGLWLSNAAHANSMATQLALLFKSHGLPLAYPTQANAVFVYLSPAVAAHLRQDDIHFYTWDESTPNTLYRFVTAFTTTTTDLATLARSLQTAP